MNLKEIELRLAAISTELAGEGANIEELETEVANLLEERAKLNDGIEKRNKLIQTVNNLPATAVAVYTQEERGKEMNTTFNVESPEYRSAWLKKLQGAQLTEVEERAFSSVAGSAGAVIPTETQNMVITSMAVRAPMIAEIELLQIPGNIAIPAEGTVADAAQHAENADVTAAEDTLDTISLGAYEFIKIQKISATVSVMAVPAFESWLVSKLSEKLADVIEDKIINGNGTNTVKGIAVAATWSTASNLVEVTGTYVLTYQHVLKAIGKLPSKYARRAKFLAGHEMIYSGFANVLDANGRPILVTDATGVYPNRILGFPVIESDFVAAKTFFLGDFKQYVGNLSQPIKVDKSTEAGFSSNSVLYRGTAMFDGKPAAAGAFVKGTVAKYAGE